LFFSLRTEVNNGNLDIQWAPKHFKSVHLFGCFLLILLVVKFNESKSFAAISIAGNTSLLGIELLENSDEIFFIGLKG